MHNPRPPPVFGEISRASLARAPSPLCAWALECYRWRCIFCPHPPALPRTDPPEVTSQRMPTDDHSFLIQKRPVGDRIPS
ncbi:hypothetical protein CDAR_127151 [Caerostris darwini]|uniref:Uncharacterized protein n=1 Tax=Caerostris darwini TaxID=1538125 RepID=A0AAV4X8J6_9ARAC|nr:hypothetical protein CDAR_127151 [Caerostris darwini]